jgi:hypothetical protein
MFNHIKFLEILEQQIEIKKPSLKFMLVGDLSTKLNTLFCNLRGTENYKGKRLTEQGRILCSSIFENYQVNYSKDHRITNSDLIWLDNNTKMPYWLSPDELVLYEKQLGVLMCLNDGDITQMINQQVNFDKQNNISNWRESVGKYK